MSSFPSTTAVVAANAMPGQGGQGADLVHVLTAMQHLAGQVTCFSRGKTDMAEHPRVPHSPRVSLLQRVPLVRRRSDWIIRWENADFDAFVAGHLPEADVFMGLVGQCVLSQKAALRLGQGVLLNANNMHVDQLADAVRSSCAEFGIRPFITPATVEQTRAEYLQAHRIRVMASRAYATFVEAGVPEEKLYIARPFLDLEEFPEEPSPAEDFRVIFVGLFAPWKGFHHVVRAYAAAGLPKSSLTLWGAPGHRPMSNFLLEQVARTPSIRAQSGDIRRMGYANVYGKADVLVLPSLTDGFGLVVAEAMASGLPVIVSEATGAADLVRDGENGFVVAVGDEDAITEHLRTLARDRDLCWRMGQAAREAASTLTFDSYRQAHADAIESLPRR